MKRFSGLFSVLCAVTVLACAGCASGSNYFNAAGKLYAVGDRGPAGGWILYDKGRVSDGWRYLEAASEDQSSGMAWSTGAYVKTGASGREIGAGRLNTKKIVLALESNYSAAKTCAQYDGGNMNDWFLPSEEEAKLFYENLGSKGLGGFSYEFYWCSTEDYSLDAVSRACNQHPLRPSLGSGNKALPARVRAVRAF